MSSSVLSIFLLLLLSSLTMIFPLELLLDLLRVGTIRTHKSQQPLLQVGRGAETKREHTDVI